MKKLNIESDVYLSIVIPLYNEEESVRSLLSKIIEVTKLFKFDYEIILVDDGSRDNTWEIIEESRPLVPHLRAIKFNRNYGQTAAMVAGIDYALGEIIVTMDGDLQNDPDDILSLLAKIDEGYDIVSGWRKDRKDSFTRVLPSMIANRMISLTTGVYLHDYGCSLKAYRAECIRTLQAYGEMHRFFPALASMTGARITEIPVKHYPRQQGVSKYGFERILKVFSDIFAMNLIIRFSSTPLKGFFLGGSPFIFLGIFFMLLAIFGVIFNWSSGKALFFFLLSGLTGMTGVHLFVLGFLGELIVATSDLRHTSMPEVTKQTVNARQNEKMV